MPTFRFAVFGTQPIVTHVDVEADNEEEARELLDWETALMDAIHNGPLWPQLDSIELESIDGKDV